MHQWGSNSRLIDLIHLHNLFWAKMVVFLYLQICLNLCFIAWDGNNWTCAPLHSWLVNMLIFPCCFNHSPPLWSTPGYLSASTAGVFPGFRELCAIRPVSGCRDLPHGADSLVDSGAHVGRQLPHCSTPPRGGSHFRLQQDSRPAQHKRH